MNAGEALEEIAGDLRAQGVVDPQHEINRILTAAQPAGFVFADLARRVFLVESRDRTYLHLVHPVDAEDRRVVDGLVSPGMLVCDGCKGGKYRATCHAVTKSEELLRAGGESAVQADWMAPAPKDGVA